MKPGIPLLSLLTICLVVSAVFVGRKALSNASTTPTITAGAQQSPERGAVRMIRFVLSDDGLYPRRMRVDQGLINIALEDRTNGSDGLVVESVMGDQRAKVAEVKRVENHRRGRTLIRLGPGQYLVTDASQPNRTAELTVNP